MTSQQITVADVPVRALSVTFTGEHGWELYADPEYGAGLWTALVDAGEPHGLRAVRLPRDRESCGWRWATGSGDRSDAGDRRRTRRDSGSA